MLNQLWNQRWPLLAFALSFQLLENLLFTPAMSLIGQFLDGRQVVDSTALLEFFLSPRGFMVLFLGATISLTIRLVEHAGLSVIVLGALQGKRFRAISVFRWLVGELPRLGRIGVRIFGWGLLAAAPVLLAAGLLVPPLLTQHDINYYLANRPPNFVLTAAAIGLVGLLMAALGAWLLVRWRLVVQACVFDRKGGNAAFREAAALSRGVMSALFGRCITVLAFQFVLLIVAAGLQQAGVWLALRMSGTGQTALSVALGLVVLLRTVIGAAVTSFGACAEAVVFTSFYRGRRQLLGGEPFLATIEEQGSLRARVLGRVLVLPAGLALGMLVAAGFSVAVAVNALQQERRTTVTAHRGDHKRAPENSATSIRDAIEAGADYAEIDVQLSKDGVLVVTHDSDFSRMAGVARKVWDLTYEEIRAIPLGGKSEREFRNEPAPTLEEILTLARDRIRLNIELKYYGDHQPQLAARVVEALKAAGMTHQAIIQCLEYEPLMEIHKLAPEIPVGYLMSVNAKHPGRLEVDFLAAELGRVTGAFVQAAHRRGQAVHVWTVDAPADMDRMIALSADDLITNEPREAARHVREFENLSQPERTLRRIHAWLAD